MALNGQSRGNEMKWRLWAAMCLWAVLGVVGVTLGQAAGGDNPVNGTAILWGDKLVRGGDGLIVVKVEIRSPYHIQSAKPHDPLLIPTSLSVKLPAGVEADSVKYPVAHEIAAPGGGGGDWWGIWCGGCWWAVVVGLFGDGVYRGAGEGCGGCGVGIGDD